MTIRPDRRAVLAGAAALAAAAAVSAQPASAGRLVIAVQGSPRSLEPLREFSNVSWRIGYNLFESLLALEEQDRQDSENLYRTLTEEVIPTFYARDAQGVPRRWITKIRRAMVTLVPKYNTWRMVQDYTQKYYLPSS